MGNETSTPEPEPEPAPEPAPAPAPVPDDEYKWPNLYDEMKDMGAVASLVYTFGRILDVSRKVREKEGGTDLLGLNSENLTHIVRSGLPDSELERSFTPTEVLKLIEDNLEVLAEYYEDDFGKPETLDLIKAELKDMQERACGGGERCLALEEYDDKFQDEEMVYSVCRDSLNKRITLVFRGTETYLAFKTNWLTNIQIAKTEIEVPDVLKGKLAEDPEDLSVHTGFYNYLFDRTTDPNDGEERRKYDQILADVKPLLEKYPDHKLYVTGHSLGAALSTLMAFFLSCDPDMPKPVSCINFASPRVGDEDFLAAVQRLEKTQKLRMLRAVNENDAITTAPHIGYNHVGFQVTMYSKGYFGGYTQPEIHYPKVGLGWGGWLHIAWTNSLVSNLNIGYDHGAGEYCKRTDEGKEFLEEKDLNTMYSDPIVTGFVLGSDE